jgi:hypothetical protein
MKKLYSFKLTNDSFEQVTPIDITECNDILNGFEYFSHNTFLADIANVFTKYQYMGLDFAPKIAVCLTPINTRKFNAVDKESTLDSLISLMKLLRVPSCGVQITIYENKVLHQNKDLNVYTHEFRNLWGFKEPWIGDGDYIALAVSRNKGWLKEIDLSFVYNLGLQVKEIKYGQSIEEQHDILRHAKCLVTQRGNFAYFSAFMQTPTIMLVDNLAIDCVIPINGDRIGGTAFQDSLVGYNSNITKYDYKLKHAHYDRFIFTYPECDNGSLIKAVIEDDDMQKHFINQIYLHKESYLDRINKHLILRLEEIVNEKNTVEQT